MADDDREASPSPEFDPGDSSQVRRAVQEGYVPPAPRVPALKVPGAPRVDAPKVPAKVVTKAALEGGSKDKPGHVRPALAAATSETSGVVPTDAGLEAESTKDPAVPLARRPRPKPEAKSESSSELELEPDPFGERKSVDIELPAAFDDPGSHSMRFSFPSPIARFGRYDVLGRLATGGMAEIYLAQEAFEGGGVRPVVVKVLRKQLASDEDFETLFLREGRVAMQLSHPHISTVFEFGKWGGHFFIAMEYVDGETLKDILERIASRDESLDPELAVGIVAKVAGALDYAHTARDTRRKSLGVVHRDVSPHNLMVRFDGVVKLLDFGVAKVAQSDSEDESRSDAVKGKFGYLSPEQCTASSVDGRTDVFALGICLWEALTGRRLYKRGSQFDTFRAILEEPPPSIREVRPELPEDLDAVVAKALAKRPDDRYATAAELQEALEGWLAARGAVVTASRLRRAMGELFADEIRSGPTLDASAKVAERLRAVSIHPPLTTSSRPPALPVVEEVAAAEAEVVAPRGRGGLVASVVVLAALAAAAGWFLLRGEPVADAPRATAAPSPTAGTLAEPIAEEPVEVAEERPELVGEAVVEEPIVEEAVVEEAVVEAPVVEEPTTTETSGDDEGSRARRERRERRRRPGFVADPGF